MKSNKILLIMSALFVGGAEKQYRYIMEALSNDFNVHVLLLNKPLIGKEKHTNDYVNNHKNIVFYQLDGNALNGAKKGYIKSRLEKVKSLWLQWKWLRLYLKKNKVDIAMFTYVTQLFMVPLFNKYNVNTIFNERNTGRQICDMYFKRYLLSKCDKIICNSNYAADYVHARTGLGCEVYKNGIKIKNIDKEVHSDFNILVPARINRIKNQKVVAESMSLLKDIIPNNRYNRIHCYFAGACEDEEYLKKIKKIIDRDSLNIHVIGYVSDMDKLYKKTDLIILPSFEEGTPNVLLESYMYKIDALISKIPMNVDCCTDESIMFLPNSPEELSVKIIECINRRRSEDYFDGNYKYVVDNYGLETMKCRYKNLFYEILAKRGNNENRTL